MKKIILVATGRYSINIDDYYMFYRRTGHQIVAILYHYSCQYKQWWHENRFLDPARNFLFDPIDRDRYRNILWYHADDLLNKIDHLDFDYVCMGNGTGVEQRAIVEHVGNEKCLFSEYGWLPWSEHFYISRHGCGSDSEITAFSQEDYKDVELRHAEIDVLAKKLDKGTSPPNGDYIYVPLQKDVNDFKFLSSPFKSNEEFLDFIYEITPNDLTVLVKPHPLYKKAYDLSKYGRFVNISGNNYSKYKLYKNMLAMICINSTSILEALSYNGRIFAYGEDVFVNKNILNYQVFDKGLFYSALNNEIDEDDRRCFISLLFERQISRERCLKNDRNYIESHYWNRCL